MASAIVCEDNSRRKLRTSARAKNMNYSEINDNIAKSSEDVSVSNSKPKRRPKQSLVKTKGVLESDEHLHKQNCVDEVTDTGKKLFPIFSSITSSKSPNSSVCEDVDSGEQTDEQSNCVTQKEVALFDKDNHTKIEGKSPKVKATAHRKMKAKKSKISVCDVTEMPATSDKHLISENRSTKKLTDKKISKDPHNNISLDETGIKVKTNDNVSGKEKSKNSNQTKDIGKSYEETPFDPLVPKTAIIKKQSIKEFFQKIENKQDIKNNDSKSKLFPIFNSSPLRKNGKPNGISNLEVNETVPKKRKIDNLVEPVKLSAIHIETDVSETKNCKVNTTEVKSSPDTINSLISAAQSMPAKRIRKTSKKELKTSKAFGAAVLRSCNSKFNRSLTVKGEKETNLNDASISSTGEKSVIENATANTSRKKLKRSSLKMLPQSHKILKVSKHKNNLKVKIKTATKLFPLFLKSPTVLAKKKSIQTMNLLDKKRIEANLGVKPLDTISNKITKNKIMKRGRKRIVKSPNLSPMKSVTEIESLVEISDELTEIGTTSNNSEVDEKVKRKSEKPEKDSSSMPLDSSTNAKDVMPDELIEIEALSDVSEVSKKFERGPGAVKNSGLPGENSSENKEMSDNLPNDSIDAVHATMFERMKKKTRKQSKVLISTASFNKTESTEMCEAFPNEKMEMDSISENKVEVPSDSRRKSLRQRKVISYSYPKSPIKEEKVQKKKNIGTVQEKNIIFATDPIEKTKKGHKSVSSSKSMNEIGGRPKKVLPEASVIVESSDEEIKKSTILSTKDIIPRNVPKINSSSYADNINCSDINSKKVNVPLKKIENLSFPLYSHCFQTKTPTKVTNHCNSDYVLKDEDASDISIPEWNNIIGITEVKAIEPAIEINTIMEGSTEYFSTEPDLDEKSCSLWTNIANDYNLKEVVSESTISELTLWLKQWKSKFTKSAKHKNDKDNSLDSFSYDSNDSDADGLSNSIILMGPPGSGKTSLVFSLANEHGFKVLEVNASSCRSGRNISHQLKEALESYHVENLKVSDVKDFEKKQLIFSSTKSKPSKDVASKKQTSKGIASFFQKDKSCTVNAKEVNKTSDVLQAKTSSTKPPSKKSKLKAEKGNSQSSHQDVEAPKESNPCSISSHTIILFDDIDVVFQEDEGFWSTIRGFLKISKKPVIFTVSRNLDIVKSNLDLDIQILHLKPMISEIAIQKLQDQFKNHKRENKNLNIDLLTANSNDVRRNLLHAQFWSQFASNQAVPISKKFSNINTFFLGSSDCTADLNYFVSKPSSNACNLIYDYHEIGYDILHTNLFSMFNVNGDQKVERQWQIVTKRPEEEIRSDCDSETEATNGIPKSNLWQEACEIFELKKKALKNGSSSHDLFLFSNILEDFSLVDTLKGHFSKNTNWISLPERLKKWTDGMPMCNDTSIVSPASLTLDAISSIQVLRLKEAQNLYSKKLGLVHGESKILVLEHSIPTFDNTDGNKTEKQVEIVASVVPANLSINKSIVNLDYLSTLKIMCQYELLKQTRTGKRSNRFLHYFDSISLLLEKQEIELILH